MKERIGKVSRKTGETDICMELCLDGSGCAQISTGIGFFDHMLDAVARHGFFDLKISARGDLNVDCHHTVEDVGIVFGTALREALKDKRGIRRYGSCILPMDETLALCVVDLSGRPYLSFLADFPTERIGEMDTEMVREFFYAVSYAAGINLHIRILDGKNSHHMAEAIFKAFARALDEAVSTDQRIRDVLSTKGSL